MGYKVEMECTQTVVGEHSEVGYRAGDRLPVGHEDANTPGWRPVVVEVEDEEPAEPPAHKPVEKPAPAPSHGKSGGKA